MIRLLGAALLMAGCCGLGLSAVNRLDGRVRDLRELSAGLELLQRELGWRLAPLPQALEAAAGGTHGQAARFFTFCAQESKQRAGTPFRTLWDRGLEQCPLRLNREDRILLEQLGPILGRYDGDSQRQAVENVLAGLGRRQAQAEDDRQRLGRVYGVLGLTAGLLLTLMLI